MIYIYCINGYQRQLEEKLHLNYYGKAVEMDLVHLPFIPNAMDKDLLFLLVFLLFLRSLVVLLLLIGI